MKLPIFKIKANRTSRTYLIYLAASKAKQCQIKMVIYSLMITLYLRTCYPVLGSIHKVSIMKTVQVILILLHLKTKLYHIKVLILLIGNILYRIILQCLNFKDKWILITKVLEITNIILKYMKQVKVQREQWVPNNKVRDQILELIIDHQGNLCHHRKLLKEDQEFLAFQKTLKIYHQKNYLKISLFQFITQILIQVHHLIQIEITLPKKTIYTLEIKINMLALMSIEEIQYKTKEHNLLTLVIKNWIMKMNIKLNQVQYYLLNIKNKSTIKMESQLIIKE